MRRMPFNTAAAAFVLKLTNWLVLPLRRVLPSVFGQDSASLAGAYLLQVVAIAVAVLFRRHAMPIDPPEMMIFILFQGVRSTLRLTIYFFLALLIGQAILSWINPYSPLYRPLNMLTDPLLRPLRRIIPPVSNIDLTPLIAILVAQVILLFL
jgi:YggT family protein